MKKIIYLIIPTLMFVMSSFSGCESTSSNFTHTDTEVNAIIKYISGVDFCNDYMVEVHSEPHNKLYRPKNLSEEFAVDNLSVKITFDILNDTTYNCGFGGYVPIIHINSIVVANN